MMRLSELKLSPNVEIIPDSELLFLYGGAGDTPIENKTDNCELKSAECIVYNGCTINTGCVVKTNKCNCTKYNNCA